MSSIKVSVIITTARLGGFDVLFDFMRAQQFEDFEVIISDEFYHERNPYWLGELFRHSSYRNLNFIHLPPKRECRIYDDSAGMNMALAAASGELAVILADYTWAPPNYLAAHWEFYKANPGWSMSCYMDRYELPPMKTEPYSIERDWWSVFVEDFSSSWFDGREPVYRERRGAVGKIHEEAKIENPREQV